MSSLRDKAKRERYREHLRGLRAAPRRAYRSLAQAQAQAPPRATKAQGAQTRRHIDLSSAIGSAVVDLRPRKGRRALKKETPREAKLGASPQGLVGRLHDGGNPLRSTGVPGALPGTRKSSRQAGVGKAAPASLVGQSPLPNRVVRP